MHLQFAPDNNYLPRLARQLMKESESPRLLCVGAGTENSGGSLAKLGPHLFPRTLRLDIFPNPDIDVVARCEQLPFRDHMFDCILSLAVFEHVQDLESCVNEVCRVLKPGGYLVVDIPFMQPFHADPSDYRRLTHLGIKELFPGMATVEQGIALGPTFATARILQTWLCLFFSFGNPWLHRAIRRASNHLVSLANRLDQVVMSRHKNAYLIASGFFWIGRAPAEASGESVARDEEAAQVVGNR